MTLNQNANIVLGTLHCVGNSFKTFPLTENIYYPVLHKKRNIAF